MVRGVYLPPSSPHPSSLLNSSRHCHVSWLCSTPSIAATPEARCFSRSADGSLYSVGTLQGYLFRSIEISRLLTIMIQKINTTHVRSRGFPRTAFVTSSTDLASMFSWCIHSMSSIVNFSALTKHFQNFIFGLPWFRILLPVPCKLAPAPGSRSAAP